METGRSSAWRSKDRPRLLTMHAMVEKLHKAIRPVLIAFFVCDVSNVAKHRAIPGMTSFRHRPTRRAGNSMQVLHARINRS